MRKVSCLHTFDMFVSHQKRKIILSFVRLKHKFQFTNIINLFILSMNEEIDMGNTR